MQEEYRQKIEAWRKERDDSLRSPDGWLSLAGLFVLEEGVYELGSAERAAAAGANVAAILLPPSAPSELGTLTYKDGRATLNANPSEPVFVDGVATTSVEMVDNRNGQRPTVVRVGSISMNLHRYGELEALRVRDSSQPAIKEFPGCKWFEIKPEYRAFGHITLHSSPASIPVTTSVNTLDQYRTIGTIDFELLGKPLQLLASPASKPNQLFIIFRDATTGRTTYGAGRYLYAEVDENGEVILDFNKAYSPPCAFTPYATCALAPAQNSLPIAVEAGELY